MTNTQIIKGKVKTVFTTSEPDKVLIQYEDRVTAGNGKKELWKEGKGKVCMDISALLFKELEKHRIKTHYLDTFPERIMSCRKVDIIPIEFVVRNVAAGSIVRETTLEKGRLFNWPLVEYYLKDDEKDDPLLTRDRINLMGYSEELDLITHISREVNAVLKGIFRKIGITLVDFKLEFGYDSEKNILLADELSPDGMRLWKEGTQESFDKDLFRKDKGDILVAYKEILSKLEHLCN
tara:strand:+ start:40 stop:747 length:708 start_codon:yes stop_codon:yes gene_type:complete